MRIYAEFDSLEEFQAFGSGNGRPPSTPYPTPPSDPIPGENTQGTVPAPAKRGRKPKDAIVPATSATTTAPPPVTVTPTAPVAAQDSEFDDAPSGGDDEFDTPVPVAAATVTKDDVRAALVGYQDRLTAGGAALEAARVTVMALLKKVGGADKLGALAEDKFQAVINAAKNAK